MKNSPRLPMTVNLTFGIRKKHFISLAVGLALFLGFNCQSYQMIDGVTAASRTAKIALPTLQVSATPSIVNNIIQVDAGKPVTITVNASDPNGYNQSVYSGLWQNNSFYTPSSGYYTPNGTASSTSAILPSGAQIKNTSSVNNMVFTWTPQASAQPLTLQFESYNFFNANNVTHTLGQPITIKVMETTNPSFDPGMSAQQTLPIATLAKIPVTVNPDADNDNVNISALKLPAGATLSKASKNAKGQWLAVMTWTPTLKQLGNNSITFTATEPNETGQVTFPVNFTVQDLSTPTFSPTMLSLPKTIVNQKLTYKVILKPDAVTSNVLITATGLPTGAVLSKPVLSAGQIVATMTWTPTKTQLNTSSEVTFTAEDNVAGALPVTFKTTFTVTSK